MYVFCYFYNNAIPSNSTFCKKSCMDVWLLNYKLAKHIQKLTRLSSVVHTTHYCEILLSKWETLVTNRCVICNTIKLSLFIDRRKRENQINEAEMIRHKKENQAVAQLVLIIVSYLFGYIPISSKKYFIDVQYKK